MKNNIDSIKFKIADLRPLLCLICVKKYIFLVTVRQSQTCADSNISIVEWCCVSQEAVTAYSSSKQLLTVTAFRFHTAEWRCDCRFC